MSEQAATSIRQIIRASAISGIGSTVYIVAGIVKTKAIALFLGPSGVGLFGLFQSILSTAGTISGAGLNSSGVQQIAKARADDDQKRLILIRTGLSRSSVILGLIGMAVVIACRDPIAQFSLGNTRFSNDLIVIGLGVWCFVISGVQTGILNGMHRIGDLARVSIVGSLISIPVTIALVWFYEDHGVAAAVALSACSTLVVSWWYLKRADLPQRMVSLAEISAPLKNLFNLGIVLMAASLVTIGSQMLARIMITRTLNIAATGHFQAAWSISMLYLGFALNAMGTDYYPRLTAVVIDRSLANKLINEQLFVALSLTGPVILGMLTFSSFIVRILFSGEFTETVGILRLQLLGDVFKVSSWPLAFLLPASGYGKTFLAVELSWNLTYLLLLWFGLPIWGITSAGLAFICAYVVYFIVVLVIVRRISVFSFSSQNINLFVMYVLCACIVFVLGMIGGIVSSCLALGVTAVAAYYSLLNLAKTAHGSSVLHLFKRS